MWRVFLGLYSGETLIHRTKEQNLLANWLLELLKSEQKWDVLFAQSQDKLSELADEALLKHRMGKTQPLNPETL